MIRNAKALTYSAYASMLFLGVSITIIGAAARNVGLTPSQIGLLVSMQHLGFIVAVLAAGALADTHSKTRLLFIGSLVLAFSFLTFFVSKIFWINLAVMFLAGSGAGICEGTTDVFLFDLHEKDQSRYVSINHFFVTIGAALITAYLIFLDFRWRESVVQSGVAVLALAAFFAFAKAPGRAPSGLGFFQRFASIRNRRLVAMLFAATAMAVGVELGTMGFLTTFLMDLHGLTQEASKIGLLIFFAGAASGRLLLGLISKNEHLPRNIMILFAASIFVYAGLFFVHLGLGTFVLIYLAGATVATLGPLMIALGALTSEDSPGAVIGIIKAAIPAGGFLIPFVMSLVSGSSRLNPASLAVFPIAAFLGLAVIFAETYGFKSFKA